MSRSLRLPASLLVILVGLVAPALSGAESAAHPASTVGQVAERPEDVGPLPVGQRIPPVIVYDVDGRPLPLDRELGADYTALIFYRGGW